MGAKIKNIIISKKVHFWERIFITKGIKSLPQTLIFYPYMGISTLCRRPYVFQTKNSARSNNQIFNDIKGLNYQVAKI